LLVVDFVVLYYSSDYHIRTVGRLKAKNLHNFETT
jgi:hypothetical protein